MRSASKARRTEENRLRWTISRSCPRVYNSRSLRTILISLIGIGLHAQWINYPTAGVPKNKDGSVNLTAPAPKMAGHPDLSGIWLAERNRPCPVGGCTDMDIGQEFMD